MKTFLARAMLAIFLLTGFTANYKAQAALVWADGVYETSVTTGTGALTLDGAVANYITFATGVGNNNTCYYIVKLANGSEYERGLGTYNAGVLTRTAVYSSSNSNNAVNFSAGTKYVTIDISAKAIMRQFTGADLTNGQILIGSTGASPVASTLTAGTNVTITNGAGTSTISATSGATRIVPGGRLTLSSAVPVPITNLSPAGTVYYTPYKHDMVPIYDGSIWTPTAVSEVSQATTDNTKSPAACTTESCYDFFVWNDSGVMRCTRGPAWSNTATITVTIATPAVVSWTAHGLHEGSPVIFTTTGALPTGITAGTTYYVTNTPGANSFNISTTIDNAKLGTKIATSGSQSGTHTGTNRDSIRGTGAGTSELERVSGVLMNKVAITNGPGAQRGTYVGTVRTDTSSLVCDSDSQRFVFNMYNRVPTYMRCRDGTDSWSYNTAVTIRPANNSVVNGTSRVEFVIGGKEAEDTITATNLTWITQADAWRAHGGIGLNATNANSDYTGGSFVSAGTAGNDVCTYNGVPPLGANYFIRTECNITGVTGTTTFIGDNGSPEVRFSGMTVRLNK